MKPPPVATGGGAEVDTEVNSKATSSTLLPPSQDRPPRDFEPAAYPIIARHWFGMDRIDPSEFRPIWWRLHRREGRRLPAEPGVILIKGQRP